MTVVFVEGESDRVALEVLSSRMDAALPPIVVIGGASGARPAAEELPGERIIGLVDANERAQFERVVDDVFVCDPDLEGEFVRTLGIDAVERLLQEQGELASFRRLQNQPAQRGRPVEAQLARFFGGRSGNKSRYARLLAEAVPLERTPPPLEGLIRLAATRLPGSGPAIEEARNEPYREHPDHRAEPSS